MRKPAHVLLCLVSLCLWPQASQAIVGGTDIADEPLGTAHGFLVAIESTSRERSDEIHRCMGVAIALDVVVTAGHCLNGTGRTWVKFLESTSPLRYETIEARQWAVHPMMNGGYSGEMYANYKLSEADRYHDIAVILLDRPSDVAIPAPLVPRGFDPNDHIDEDLSYYTFGHERDGMFVPRAGIQFAALLNLGYLGPAKHCYKALTKPGKLVCEGDSGAPITMAADDRDIPGRSIHHLVGIQASVGGNSDTPYPLDAALAHWGSRDKFPVCGSAVTYVDIHSHLDWIREKLAQMDSENPRDPETFARLTPQPYEPPAPEPLPAPQSPAHPQDLQGTVCIVLDPEDSSANVRATPNGEVVNRLRNGRSVVVASISHDDQGRPWMFVESQYNGQWREWGYIFGPLLDCPGVQSEPQASRVPDAEDDRPTSQQRLVHLGDECVVHDPQDTSPIVRATPNGEVVNRLRNGRSVIVGSVSFDSQGRPWMFVAGDYKGRWREWGYIFGELLDCR